ncbi:MAG: hypothetical protein ACXACA_02965 [Candidatus Ranarchaeia archaeon]|jgi:hypothetical protein
MSTGNMKRFSRVFVFIETKPGVEQKVMDKLMAFEEVIETHIYQGQHDIVALLEMRRDIVSPGSAKIAEFVSHKIEGMKEVTGTEVIIPSVSISKPPKV